MLLPVGYEVKSEDDWCDVFSSFLAIKTGATDHIGIVEWLLAIGGIAVLES